ncbi:MAG: sulfotransferase domain-containing protein [Planctomycetaceae bacterium]
MPAASASADGVDFLGIGVQKGGTTWLYHQLSRHPQVAFPRGKEVHYWDAAERPDADEWVRLLQPSSRKSRSGRPIKTGEITPAYATLPVDAIRAIHARCPDIRLFISLRNPLERAWSAALMGLARAQMLVHEASDQWFLDHFRSSASRARGDYVGCLDRWWGVFPRDRLLVLFQDDIAARPAAVLDVLAAHLGLDAAEFATLPTKAVSEVVVPGLGDGVVSAAPPPLRPALLAPLLDLYGGDITRLEQLTGRDLTAWRKPQPPRSLGPRTTSHGAATQAADADA